jgi:hypothetical protein
MYCTNQPILRDFNSFLDYISQSKSLELTKDKGCLRSADLLQLNDLMHVRVGNITPKSKQQAFSLLNTFFYIARSAQLFLVNQDPKTKKTVLTVNGDRIALYDAMSDDERYFSLLEGFWSFVDWDEAYDCRAFSDERFYKELTAKPVGKSITVSNWQTKQKGQINSPIYAFASEVFQAFGLITLIPGDHIVKTTDRNRFPYQAVVLSELGKALLPILVEERNHIWWGYLDPFFTEAVAKRTKEREMDPEDQVPEPDGTPDELSKYPYHTAFSTAFLPAFPDLKIENRLFPIERPFTPGRFVLRIALNNSCYREISIGANASLDDLHDAIQNLFEFDDDHLYAFYLNGRRSFNKADTYSDPRGSLEFDEKPADVFNLGEVGLYEGKVFRYLFDFGHSWKFDITVLSIDSAGSPSADYNLLKSVGESPEQYPDWNEED